MGPASERRHYYVTPSLIGWSHTQNDLLLSYIVWVGIVERHQHQTPTRETGTLSHVSSIVVHYSFICLQITLILVVLNKISFPDTKMWQVVQILSLGGEGPAYILSQCRGCWYPGNARGTSSHGIGIFWFHYLKHIWKLNKMNTAVYPKNFHDSSEICPMGIIYSIQICEITHQTFGPLAIGYVRCVWWFSWTLIQTHQNLKNSHKLSRVARVDRHQIGN